jgi:hypothetical protein
MSLAHGFGSLVEFECRTFAGSDLRSDPGVTSTTRTAAISQGVTAATTMAAYPVRPCEIAPSLNHHGGMAAGCRKAYSRSSTPFHGEQAA